MTQALSINTEQLIVMMDMQDKLNTMQNADWRTKNFDWHRAIWMEASEMLERAGYKWWKKQLPVDTEQQRIELVDIWHFLMSWFLQQDMGSQDIINLVLIAKKTEVPTNDPPENPKTVQQAIEAVAKSALNLNSWSTLIAFLNTCQYYNLDFKQLYHLYLNKNLLNQFRNNHGYKTGEYRKHWFDGREDNEHLADIMDEIDQKNQANGTPFDINDVNLALEAAYNIQS